MWPDDYIDWALRIRPQLPQQVGSPWRGLLSRNARLLAEVSELADQAAREAFDLAYGHYRHESYFASETQFRVWLVVIAEREMVRLLLRHEEVEPAFNRLSADHRRLLGMVYLDRLPSGDVTAVLQFPPEEIGRRTREALTELLRLL
jgi:DNA-directed RNA polymerase specialized sigma24 family protein